MRGAIHPLPQYIFMAWCLVKHRDNFTLLRRQFESSSLSNSQILHYEGDQIKDDEMDGVYSRHGKDEEA
jgi:hypothetical protein